MSARRFLPALAAAMLLGGTSAVLADARVDAFRQTCTPERQDYDRLLGHVRAEGWEAATGDEHPSLTFILGVSRNVVLDPGMTSGFAAFRRDVGGRPAYLVAAYLRSADIDLVSCYFYDFGATATIAPDLFTDWLGAPPAHSTDDRTLVSHVWETPEKLPGIWDVYVGYSAPGSHEAEKIGFSGLAFRMTAVDPKDK